MVISKEREQELFKKFVFYQNSGRYNMFMEGVSVAKKMGCSLDEYEHIMFNYSKIKKGLGNN